MRMIPTLIGVGFLAATFRVAWISNVYPLTLAPFVCLLLLAYSTRAVSWREWGRASLFLVLTAALPVILLLIAGGSGAVISKFPTTYILWLGNFGMLVWAMTAQLRAAVSPGIDRASYLSLWLLSLFAVVQFGLANGTGSTALYNIWGDNSFEGVVSLSRYAKDGIFRAPSAYYEPSLFGRTIVCLLAALLISNWRPVPALLVCTAGVIVSLSAGAIIFLGGLFVIWLFGYRERRRQTFIILIIILSIALFTWPIYLKFVFERLDEIGSAYYNSGFVRVTLPLSLLTNIFEMFPFGAPLGSNSMLASADSYFVTLSGNEGRVTSGLYELVIYTGWPGVVAVAALAILGVGRLIMLRWRDAMLIYVLLGATVVSSSFLAFESTISFLPVILAWRRVQAREREDVRPRSVSKRPSSHTEGANVAGT